MTSEEKNRGPGVGRQRQSTSILTGVVGCEATSVPSIKRIAEVDGPGSS